MLEQV
jgi:hypothetical protein